MLKENHIILSFVFPYIFMGNAVIWWQFFSWLKTFFFMFLVSLSLCPLPKVVCKSVIHPYYGSFLFFRPYFISPSFSCYRYPTNDHISPLLVQHIFSSVIQIACHHCRFVSTLFSLLLKHAIIDFFLHHDSLYSSVFFRFHFRFT